MIKIKRRLKALKKLRTYSEKTRSEKIQYTRHITRVKAKSEFIKNLNLVCGYAFKYDDALFHAVESFFDDYPAYVKKALFIQSYGLAKAYYEYTYHKLPKGK